MKYLHGFSCALFVAACGTSAAGGENGLDTSDPQAADVEDGQAQAASSDGGIPAPNITLGGSSRATATTNVAGAGLVVDGGIESAAYAIASYTIATGTMGATAEFTVDPAPGAAFTYAVRGTGGGYVNRYLRVQRVPGSDALAVVSANGPVVCGQLPSGQPTSVTVSFDGAAHTVDVLIAGAQTACTDLPTKAGGPITGFRVTDEAIAGYGGHVEFTNFALTGF